MTYFQGKMSDSALIASLPPPYKLQAGDRLNIFITALNPLTAVPFNIVPSPLNAQLQGSASDDITIPGGSTSSASAMTAGSAGFYYVDADGNIKFPQLGDIPVVGLTTKEVEKALEKKLTEYIKGPTALVTVTNFRINVLGEVTHPGIILVPNAHINILEAIAESGDLTVYGQRQNIMVIREKDGKREIGRMDLSSNDIFTSPFFQLQQGDVVYVEANNKSKAYNTDASETEKFRITSLILTGIAAIAVMITALRH